MWINFNIKQPTPGQYIYVPKDDQWASGECVASQQTIKIIFPNNISQEKIKISRWLPVPSPRQEKWVDWSKEEPPAGTYILIRDPAYPDDYELAWSLGQPGKIEAVFPNDPSNSRVKEEEWQLISDPPQPLK